MRDRKAFKTRCPKTQSFQQQQIRPPHRIGRILEAYFDDELIFRRGQTLVDVPITGDEVAALTAVQYALRHGIAQRGIVVEVNTKAWRPNALAKANLLIDELCAYLHEPPQCDTTPEYYHLEQACKGTWKPFII